MPARIGLRVMADDGAIARAPRLLKGTYAPIALGSVAAPTRMRRAFEVRFGDALDVVRVEPHVAAVVMNREIGMVVLRVRDEGDRVHERDRLVIVVEPVGLLDCHVGAVRRHALSRASSDFTLELSDSGNGTDHSGIAERSVRGGDRVCLPPV